MYKYNAKPIPAVSQCVLSRLQSVERLMTSMLSRNSELYYCYGLYRKFSVKSCDSLSQLCWVGAHDYF